MPGAVHATPVLDQSVNASPDTGFRFSDYEDLVALQTFTVGTLGNSSWVSVGVVRVGSYGGPSTTHNLTQSLTIGIWKWEDPVPTSYDPYFSMTLQPSKIPEEVDEDDIKKAIKKLEVFSANVTQTVTQGTKKHPHKMINLYKCMNLLMVPKAGLEPARVSPLPPQDSVSTKFHHFGTCSIRTS